MLFGNSDNLQIKHKLRELSLTGQKSFKKIPDTDQLTILFSEYVPEVNLNGKLPDLESLNIISKYKLTSHDEDPAFIKLGKLNCKTLQTGGVYCQINPGSKIDNFVFRKPDKKDAVDLRNFKGVKSLFIDYVNEWDRFPEVDELFIFGWDSEMTLPIVKCKVLISYGPVKIKPGSEIDVISTFGSYVHIPCPR